MSKNLQFLRSFTSGGTPTRLLPGEVAFNVADKLMFVGDGSSSYTAVDGSQTAASFSQEGWFAVDLETYPELEAVSQAVTEAQSDATDALTRIGVMAGLDTMSKETLVSAINEALSAANAAAADAAAAQSTADNAQGATGALEISLGLAIDDKLDKPADEPVYGQVVTWTGGPKPTWETPEAASTTYVPHPQLLGVGTVQQAIDSLASTNATQAGQISAALADAQEGINLANAAQDAADAAQNAADAAQGTADTALLAAQNAQGDVDALDVRVTSAEGSISDLISDVSDLQTGKQDSLGSGTEGQFLRYISGAPAWSSFDPKLGSVATAANLAAFEAIQAAAGEGDVVVIVDAIGLAASGTGYSVSNLASSVTENFSISLIKDAAGSWLVLATPGSITQAVADALYASKSISVSAGTGLEGGGDLSANRTIGIADNGVTYGKIQQATQKALIGAGAAGNVQEITLDGGLDITAGVLSVNWDFGTF